MTRLNPPKVAAPATAPSDPRIGHILGTRLAKGEQPQAVILGFPADEGVRRNGGRVGAAQGPEALRQALYRLTPDARSERHVHLLSRTRDVGDLNIRGDVESDQQAWEKYWLLTSLATRL